MFLLLKLALYVLRSNRKCILYAILVISENRFEYATVTLMISDQQRAQSAVALPYQAIHSGIGVEMSWQDLTVHVQFQLLVKKRIAWIRGTPIPCYYIRVA